MYTHNFWIYSTESYIISCAVCLWLVLVHLESCISCAVISWLLCCVCVCCSMMTASTLGTWPMRRAPCTTRTWRTADRCRVCRPITVRIWTMQVRRRPACTGTMSLRRRQQPRPPATMSVPSPTMWWVRRAPCPTFTNGTRMRYTGEYICYIVLYHI